MEETLKQKMAVYKNLENAKKMAELVKKGISISPEELSEAYASAETIKEVKVHCHRPPLQVDIGKVDSLQELSENDRKFMKSASDSLKISIMPDIGKALNSIYNAIRIEQSKCCIGGSDLMEVTAFTEEFLPYLEKKQQEINTKIYDYIDEHYEEEMQSFRTNVHDVVSKVFPERLSQVMKEVEYITKRPKESFKSAISIDLETDFGTSVVNKEDLKNFLEQAKKEHYLKEGIAVICGTIKNLWEAVVTYLNVIKDCKRDLSSYQRRRMILDNAAAKAIRENVANLDFINEIAKKMKELSKILIKDEADEEALTILAYIYGQSVNFGLELNLSSKKPEWLSIELVSDTYEELVEASIL